jgi:hypothetical protein
MYDKFKIMAVLLLDLTFAVFLLGTVVIKPALVGLRPTTFTGHKLQYGVYLAKYNRTDTHAVP